jgi:hypothetical protein
LDEAVQVRTTALLVTDVEVRLVGAVGGVVSEPEHALVVAWSDAGADRFPAAS